MLNPNERHRDFREVIRVKWGLKDSVLWRRDTLWLLAFSSSNHGTSPNMKDDCLWGKKSHQKPVLALSDLGILGHRTVRK